MFDITGYVSPPMWCVSTLQTYLKKMGPTPTVYLGTPLSHILYNPRFPEEMCSLIGVNSEELKGHPGRALKLFQSKLAPKLE